MAMEFVQDYITLLPRLLPASIANPLLSVITTCFGITKALQSHLSPLLTRIVTQPDVASILALLAILYISLKVLDMAYRAVMFWVKLVFRLVIFVTVASVGLWVWNRGVDGFADDVQGLTQYWWGEYAKFANEAKRWKEAEEVQVKFESWKQGGKGRRKW